MSPIFGRASWSCLWKFYVQVSLCHISLLVMALFLFELVDLLLEVYQVLLFLVDLPYVQGALCNNSSAVVFVDVFIFLMLMFHSH